MLGMSLVFWSHASEHYSDLATRRERHLTTACVAKIPARNWVDFAVAFWLNRDLAKRYELNAHVLEQFIRCSLTFQRLLIDNKQARCFSFEFRLFNLSPRKSKRRNSNEKHLACLLSINSLWKETQNGLFSFGQRDCVYWAKLTFLAFSSALPFGKLDV